MAQRVGPGSLLGDHEYQTIQYLLLGMCIINVSNSLPPTVMQLCKICLRPTVSTSK